MCIRDRQVVLLRQFDDAPAALDRERAPARILEGGDRVEESRLGPALQLALERLGVEPLVVHRYRAHLDTVIAQNQERTVVARRLDQHAAADAAPEELLGQVDETLQRAVGEQDLARIDRVALAQPLPQWCVAEPGAVRENAGSVALDRALGTVGQQLDGKAFRRRSAASEGDHPHGAAAYRSASIRCRYER